ncbi:MAG: GGDEF domain-containing protein [Myxococcaceae bacterium]
MAQIPDDLADELTALFGQRIQVHREKATEQAVRALLDAEKARRGEPDAITGAFHVLSLTQGALLRYEYDLPTHGHYEGWEIGAVIVDPVELIKVNQSHGFPAGDATLRAIADTLQDVFPTGRLVRIHSDALAMLLPPSSERVVDAGLEQTTREALRDGVPRRLAAAGLTGISLDYTVALLHLIIEHPSHWQVLGPLVWAESERALVLARTRAAQGVQRRRIPLEASVPITTREPLY